MQAGSAVSARIRAICAGLILVLSLVLAPATLAVKHGPGTVAAEADHRAFHAEHGHAHEMPGGHHDATDHDHVGAALLVASGLEVDPALPQILRPETLVACGTCRTGPRRPPRLTMT